MGGRGSRSSTGAGGSATPVEPAPTPATPQQAEGLKGTNRTTPAPKADVGEGVVGTPNSWKPADVKRTAQGNLAPGFSLQERPANVGSYRYKLTGKDGGSVGAETRAQAVKISRHLNKHNLPTNLSNVPSTVMFR